MRNVVAMLAVAWMVPACAAQVDSREPEPESYEPESYDELAGDEVETSEATDVEQAPSADDVDDVVADPFLVEQLSEELRKLDAAQFKAGLILDSDFSDEELPVVDAQPALINKAVVAHNSIAPLRNGAY